jgi:hypothetical protein
MTLLSIAATVKFYINNPACGDNSALIVVNLTTVTARRALEGHFSVIPEAVD